MDKRELLPINTIDELKNVSEILVQSQCFAGISGAKAAVKILAGRELGFATVASMAGIHIIDGQPVVGAHLMASMIKRSGKYTYRVLELNRLQCKIQFLEKVEGKWEELPSVVEMTFQEAVSSGLAVGKDGKIKRNWEKHPDDMLFARCISKGFRRHCPDLTSGITIYVEDEVYDDDDVIDVQAVEIPQTNFAHSSTPIGPVELDTSTDPISAPVPNSQAPLSESTTGLISSEERETIVNLWREHKRSVEEMQQILAILKIKALDQLTVQQIAWVKSAIIQGLPTTEARDAIASLVSEKNFPWEKIQARLQERYGVNSIAHLTRPQAEDLLARLKSS